MAAVYRVAWSADSRMLVSASKDTTLKAGLSLVNSTHADHKLWDLKTFKIRIDLPGHTDEVYCVDFIADKVVSGGRDKTVKMSVPLYLYTSELTPQVAKLDHVFSSFGNLLHICIVSDGPASGRSHPRYAIQVPGTRLYLVPGRKSSSGLGTRIRWARMPEVNHQKLRSRQWKGEQSQRYTRSCFVKKSQSGRRLRSLPMELIILLTK